MTRPDRRSYPLRKILYSDMFYQIRNEDKLNLGIHDYLECGHTLPQAQDIYGTYHPIRRRCHKCGKGKELDFIINQS